jgi:hypothetical protein
MQAVKKLRHYTPPADNYQKPGVPISGRRVRAAWPY